jgi:hypothetical protein
MIKKSCIILYLKYLFFLERKISIPDCKLDKKKIAILKSMIAIDAYSFFTLKYFLVGPASHKPLTRWS